MKKYKYKKLNEVCEPKQWTTLSKDKLKTSGYPVYGASDVIGYYHEFNHEHETITIGCRGTCGKVNIVPPKSYINGNAMCLDNLSKDYLPKFLHYYLTYFDFTDVISGSTIPQITKESLQKVYVPAMSLKEQKSIVEKLDLITDAIKCEEDRIKLYDEVVKSRFVELFGECKNEVLIGDVISICRGASPRPIQAFITDDEDGVNWIKIGDVSENSLYITKTAERITQEGAKKSRAIHKGDFILSNSMSFGRPYILGIDGCVHDGWLILSEFRDRFDELYLYHALRSEHVQHQFSGKANGATVKNLNSDLVKATYIKVPDMKEQELFATFVKQVDKSKFEVKKSLENLNQLMQNQLSKHFE